MSRSLDSFNCRRTLKVGSTEYIYYNLIEAEKNGLTGISQLPYSMKVLLENLLRNEDGRSVTKEAIQAVAGWLTDKGKAGVEIAYRPARVLMQDFTGVPAVVDLAAMRDAMASLGGDPEKINPLVPVDLVIDHSVIVDEFGTPLAFARNVELEYERNQERYNFLKWGQQAFRNFRVVPPGTGICHQVNLEYLAQTVWTLTGEDGDIIAYPDTCVGMGVVPFVFEEGTSWASLELKGDEIVTIDGLEQIRPRQKMTARITYGDGTVKNVPILCRIDTVDELEYFRNGGILQYVLRDLAA